MGGKFQAKTFLKERRMRERETASLCYLGLSSEEEKSDPRVLLIVWKAFQSHTLLDVHCAAVCNGEQRF